MELSSTPPALPEDPGLERDRLRAVIDRLPAAAAVYAGPDHVFLAASEPYRRIVAGRDLIGRSIREVLPELGEQGFIGMLDRVYATGEPVSGRGVRADWDDDGDGRIEPHYIDFTYQPLADGEGRVWGVVAHIADVTARHQAEETLRESEARFRALFDSAGVGMAVVDTEGGLLAANDALARMLGYTVEELSALRVDRITHPDDLNADWLLFRELLEGSRASYTLEKRYLHREGRVVWGSLTVSLTRDAEGRPRYAVAVVQDITGRKRLDDERRLLAEASRVLGSSLDYEATLRTVARLAVPQVADWCAVDLLGDDGSLRRVAVEHPEPEKVALAHRLQEEYPPDPDAPHGTWKVVRTGLPDLLEEIPDALLEASARSPEHLELIRSLGLRSAVVVPLKGREETLGALTLVQAASGRRFGAEDLPFALELAGRAATAIENARLYARAEEARAAAEAQALEMEQLAEELQTQGMELEEAQAELEVTNDELQRANESLTETARAEERARCQAEEERRRAAFLAEASRILAGSLDYETTLRNVATAAVPSLGDWCAVDVLEEPGSREWPPKVRRLAVAHEDPEKVAWARELERTRPTEWDAPTGLPKVLRTGTAEFYPVITDEMLVAAARDEEELELLREIHFSSFICVPLLARGRVLGAITLCHTESDRHYDEADLGLAEELARRAAVAMDNAALYAAEQGAREAAERSAERVSLLQKVTAAFSSAVGPDRVAEVVVHDGTRAMGAAAGALAVLDDAGQTLEMVRAEGFGEVAQRFARFPVAARLPLSLAVRERRAVYIGSEAVRRADFPNLVEEFPSTRQRAWAALPLVLEGRVLGGMAFGFPAEQGFGAEDRALMEALAQQSAQALERSRLYEAEHRARADAEGASRAKSEFLAVMSHELRTPMNAILGYLDLLDLGVAGPLNEAQAGFLTRVTASGRHLLGLIEQVLTFSRIEAGREEAALETVEVGEVAREAAEMVEPLARAKGLAFRLEVAADASARTDPGKLRQVLVNLLGNGVKFTEAGEVAMTVRLSSGCEEALFAVRDTGIGIAPEALEHIFEPFWQVGQGPTRAAGGTGLGLAVARELAHMLGGEVTVESTQGVGSTFTLRIPLAGPGDGAESPES